MEEDNKVWLGLGEDLIDLSLFLTNAANNILSYVQSKPWSNKRKQSFLNAYNAIMQSGVTGATNDTGLWLLTTQSQLDPTGLSDRDQEMLGDAAYFILSQMQGVTPRGATTEESNKEKTKFVGATAFDNWVSDNYFGGNTFSRPEDWNVLDERDITTGKRGVAKRIAKMKDYLTEYRNSLNDDDWDYSESPIGKNTAEVQAKIDRAISALNGKTEIDLDIIDSLNAIGIRYRDWFDNGLGENSGHTDSAGNPLTWQQWQEQQAADAETKAKENAAKVKALNEALRANPWSKALIHKYANPVWNEREFANLLGDRDLISVLNEYASNISSLNSGQRKFVHSAYRSKIPKVQISDEEYNILKRIPGFKNASKSRFSKIAGVDGLIYDNSTKTLLSPASVEGQVSSEDPNLWIHNLSDSALKETYKNNPRGKGLNLTAKDKADLAAIGMDFAALIDWEPYSAGTLGVAAGVTRSAANWDKEHFWKSLGTSAFDVGTGALSFLPIAGDYINGMKIVKGFAKIAPWLSGYIAVTSSPEAIKAWNKLDFNDISGSVKRLTPEDYRALFNVVQGLMTGRGHIKRNLGERRVLQHTGHNVSNSRLQRLGITKTEVKSEVEVPTLKTNKGDIELTPNERADLEAKFKSGKDRTAAVKEYAEANPEFKAKLKGAGDSDFKVSQSSSPMTKARNYANWSRRTSDSFGTTSKSASQRTNDFEDWLLKRGFWSRVGYGTDKELKAVAERVGTPKVTTSETKAEETSNPVEQAKSPEQSKVTSAESKSKRQRYRNELVTKRYNDVIENGNFSKNEIKTNKTRKIGDSTISIEKNADGSYTISEIKSDLSRTDLLANSDKQVKETIARIIKEHRNTMKSSIKSGGKSWKIDEISKTLRELKRAGWLKQGGQINNFDLDTTISNFLKNLK